MLTKQVTQTSQASATLALVETAFLASTTVLLWLADLLLPLAQFVRVLLPIPIVLCALRWNFRQAALGMLAAGLLILTLCGPVSALRYVLPFGVFGLWCSYSWPRGVGWQWSIPVGALITLAGFGLQVVLASWTLGTNTWALFGQETARAIQSLGVWLGVFWRPSSGLVQICTVVLLFCTGLMFATGVHVLGWLLLTRLGYRLKVPGLLETGLARWLP